MDTITNRNIKMCEACRILGISESSLRRRYDGKPYNEDFYDARCPKPVKLFGSFLRFDLYEIIEYRRILFEDR